MKPDTDIKRILTAAIEAALEDEQPEPRQSQRDHRGLKALAIGAAPFAAGAALVTAGRAAKKRLPAPVSFGLSKLVDVPNVGDMAETARDRFGDGADALRERFVGHDDAEAPDDAQAQKEDSDDENLADEILADAYEQSDDDDADEESDDEADEESDDQPQDEAQGDEDSGEIENDERARRDPPDLVLEMNRESEDGTPDLFEALRARHPRPPVMQALNRRTKQATKSS